MRAGDPSRARWRRRGRPRYAGALTPRQQDVFELLATGLTNEEIAQQLGITPYGVKYHVAEILLRLGVENRYEAASLHLRTESNGRLAAWAPVIFLRKLPFAWLPKAAAGAVLTATAAGIALLAWGVLSTSTDAGTTTLHGESSTGCGVERSGGDPPSCAPGVAQAAPGAGGISAISAGPDHTCAVKDGGAWCWGLNSEGQLGNNSKNDSDAPASVPELESGVSAISVGWRHTCALKDGGVWCWGLNSHGQLGDNSTTESHVPVAVSGLESGVTAISTGYYHTCVLKGGGVSCWGLNDHGQLGNDRTTESHVPVAVSGMGSGVSAISASESHTCALKDSGVWCWGDNGDGQLGNNRGTDSPVPVAVAGLASGVTAVSASLSVTCAVKDGGAWCWGTNEFGQLGDGTACPPQNRLCSSPAPVAVSGLASGVTAISAGAYGACGLKDGGVWCWGMNESGELGVGTACPEGNFPCNSIVPVAVPGLASGVSAISGTCALKGDRVWCWGGGQLAPAPVPFEGDVADTTDVTPLSPQTATAGLPAGSVSAISAGGFHTCALKDGGVWCWGELGAGEPGNNESATDRLVPVAVSGLASGVSAIDGFCAVKDGGAWCQLVAGPDSTADSRVPVPLSGLASGVSVISGSCAIKDGGAWCWGDGGFGQLGNDSTANSDVPVAVSGLASGVSAISSGGYSTCALKDGGVWCWGLSGNGRLGSDRTADSPVPVAVSGLASGVSAISGGGGHYCALMEGGVWCWGYNRFGQLGQLGNDSNRDSLVPVGQLGNEGKDSPVPLAVPGLATGVSAISAGNHHTCALKHGGIWCWGENVAGGLGDGADTDSPAPVAVSGLPSGVSAISAGAYHTCALTDNGVWCWGMNSDGQLGNGTTTGPEVCGPFACSTAPVPVIGLASGVSGEEPASKSLPTKTATDSDHRAWYMLAGTAAAALAIVAAGMWAVRRRRRSRTGVDDLDLWRKPGA
ncbi:MAG: LuxR C-terminal-related transcriptional regulator [Chloroflexota bacterium]|nr:LuxR C-terminal-related transcriptional regulator [Chloroflexota bacterium]